MEQLDLVGRVDQDAVHPPMGLRPTEDRRFAGIAQVVSDHEVWCSAPPGPHGQGQRDSDVLAIGENDVCARELGEGGTGVAEREPDRSAVRPPGEPAPVEQPHAVAVLEAEVLGAGPRPCPHLGSKALSGVGGHQHEHL